MESRCLARYDDDDIWYRATVVELGHDKVTVMYDQYVEEPIKLPLEDILPLGICFYNHLHVFCKLLHVAHQTNRLRRHWFCRTHLDMCQNLLMHGLSRVCRLNFADKRKVNFLTIGPVLFHFLACCFDCIIFHTIDIVQKCIVLMAFIICFPIHVHVLKTKFK